MRELNAIWSIIRKDIGVWLRQPVAIAATLMPSLAFILVIYFSALAVGRNQIALVVEDNGPYAQQLVQVIQNEDAFITTQVSSTYQAEQMLQNLQVEAIISIPANFDAAYTSHQADPVNIKINNLNLDFTNDLRRSLPAAINDFYAQQPNSPIDIQVQETDLRQQDVGLIQFELIPILVLLLTIAGVINSGLATAREWEDNTIKGLLLAPISRTSLLLGKLLAGWLTTMVIGLVVLVLGTITGFIAPQGFYWLPTILMIAIIALANAGLGVALGAVLQRFQAVTAVGVPLSLYLFFLSGGISVAAFLPDWVQTIAHFVPTYYGVHSLQMSIFYNSTDQFGRDLLIMGVTTVVALALGVIALRKNLQV
jgi:ABC-type multidrug transport system permease subunit